MRKGFPALAASAIIVVWRITEMYRKATDVVRTAGVGMALGAAAGIAGGLALGGRGRRMKRRARSAANAVGEFIGSVGRMF